MATKILVQNSKNRKLSNSAQSEQLSSSISLMLEYDIDNTLNTLKEKSPNFLATSYQTKSKDLINHQQKIELNNNNNSKSYSNGSSSSSSPSLSSTARKRWKILAKVLRKDSEESTISSEDEDAASVRRFKTFNLLRQDTFEDLAALNSLGQPNNWYTYKILINQDEYSVNIHHIDRHLTAADLMGFNNTGNICVWPSEEALTVYCMSEYLNFQGKWILELGGGMTCLTGLMLAKYANPYVVHLTDGNVVSIENVQKTICLNQLSCYTKCSVLKWETERNYSELGKFDVILSADCLFFDEARPALVDTIWYYLSSVGVALVMAPKRNKTMSNFLSDCTRKGFNFEIIKHYNEIIWQRHLELKNSDFYDEDIHYPILIKLTKPIE